MNVEEKAAPRCVWELYGKAKGNSRNLEYEEPKYQGKKKRKEQESAAAAAAVHGATRLGDYQFL